MTAFESVECSVLLFSKEPSPTEVLHNSGAEYRVATYQRFFRSTNLLTVMTAMLPAIEVDRKDGSEQFHCSGKSLGFDILSFWRWAVSDLACNNLRGHLAEYLVAQDLGLSAGMRTEWEPFDIETRTGVRIEVKSSAYIQTWKQAELSTISFGIAPTSTWAESNTKRTTTSERKSDAYVFCLHKHKDQKTFDPTDVSQWVFYTLATSALNKHCGDQKTIRLSSLLALEPIECVFGNIRPSLQAVLGRKI